MKMISQGTHSIPAMVEGTVDPFSVSNTSSNFSTRVVWREAIIDVRASSVRAVVLED